MLEMPFRYQLAQKREQLKLTQEELGQLCGCSRSRISVLELGLRSPNPREVMVFREKLQLNSTPIDPDLWERKLRQTAWQRRPIYYSPQERPTYFRLARARKLFGYTVDAIVQRLRTRPDFPVLRAFVSRISCSSAWEALYLLALLDRGAQPAAIVPYSLDAFPCRIVEGKSRKSVGQLPHLCLLLDGAIYFFQEDLLPSTLYTVDVLVWKDGWSVLEIDGPGHDPTRDPERTLAIPLPIIRWLGKDVENFAKGLKVAA